MAVLVAGQIKHKAIESLVSQYLTNTRGRIVNLNTIITELNNNKVSFYYNNSEAHLNFTFKTCGINDKDEIKTVILRWMIRDKIILIRESLPTYWADTVIHLTKKDGYLMTSLVTIPDRSIQVVEKILNLLIKYKKDMERDDFNMAKQVTALRLSLQSDENKDVVHELGKQALSGKPLKSFKDKITEALNVSYEEMRNFLQDFISKDNLRISMIGPFSEKDKKEVERIFYEILS